MTETRDAQPSFEWVSGLLSKTPRDRLVLLKHKLNCTRQDVRSCKLLQAMVLLTLEREAEAREVLEALGDDAAAAHICRSHWGSTKLSSIPPMKREFLVAQAMAQVYSLLVDEKLCAPQARDEAYRAAIGACRASEEGQNAKLNAIVAEAQEKCGPDFALEVESSQYNTLKSDPKKFPRSAPVSINASLAPLSQPLRSTGTPYSFMSHFEISHSPTVLYRTRTASQCGDSAPSSSVQPGEGGASLVPPSVARPESPEVQAQPNSVGHHLSPAERSVHSHVERTEPQNIMSTGLQDLRGGPPPNLQAASMLQTDPAPQTPTEDSCSLPQNTSPKSTSSSVDAPPVTVSSSSSSFSSFSSIDNHGDETQFFMFVVVHASEDELIACRVKELLENLGVPNGATFCEDFLIPGHNQLACFQDALDNSAFTLLLLTENFKSRLCTFQTNMALMNSFSSIVKSNSVIPFVPKESPLKKGEIPSMLLGLASLEESSRVFEKRIKKTFLQSEFQLKKASWSMKQQVRHRERLQEQYRDWLQMQERLFALHLPCSYPHQMPFPPTQEGFPGLYHAPPSHAPPPFFLPTFPTPGIIQPPSGPGRASLFPPFTHPLPSSMPQRPQPHLIIQNAQMVQIGDYNQMQVERTNAALGAAEDERTEGQGGAAEAGSGRGD